MITSEKADSKLDYLYDNMGRRVRKQVYSGSTGSWTLDTQLKFVYDGYKLIEELDGQNSDAILRKYVWSGETPFSMTDADGTFYYVLDANKNVSELIDSTGVVRAHYEYSPSGEITVMTGDKAYENPIRFSSEYFDLETGLVYYNFRYYAPELGRWTSRDPIEEDGGMNLYGMLDNDAVNWIDLLGYVSDTRLPPNMKWCTRKVWHEKIWMEKIHVFDCDTCTWTIEERFASAIGWKDEKYPCPKDDTKGLCGKDIYDRSTHCCCNDKGIVFSRLAILQEKVKIIRLSHRWNKTSPTWSWNNQCYEQSTALKAHLGAFHKYWHISVEGRKGLILKHHVVVVSFKCINSDCGQSDFVIDPLKYFSPGTFLVQNPEQAELLLDTYTNISVYSYQSFTSDYPNPLTPRQ